MQKKENSIFSIYNTLGVKLLTRVRFQFCHLNEQKFRHSFENTLNAVYACRSEVETTEHFLLRCYLYSPRRLKLFEILRKIDSRFLNLNVKNKVSFFLYGSQSATSKSFNHDILKFLINYIKETGRFDRPLFCPN